MLPLGDQSEPIPIRTPADFSSPIRAVPPYSSRLLNGDQIMAPPCFARAAMSVCSRPTEWMPASFGEMAQSPFGSFKSKKCLRAAWSVPSLRCSRRQFAFWSSVQNAFESAAATSEIRSVARGSAASAVCSTFLTIPR